MKKIFNLFLFLWLLPIGVNSQSFIKDKTFDGTIKNLYNPATTDAGWSSYTAYPTTGTATFNSSIKIETGGNNYYQCITTTNNDTYQRALAQYTSQKLYGAKYKLTFRARGTVGSDFYLKLSTATNLSTWLPTNLTDATPGISLKSVTGGNFIVIAPAATDTWQTYSCIFDMAPTTDDFVRVYFTFDKAGTFELDDVDLTLYGNTLVDALEIASSPSGLNTITTSKGSIQLVPVISPSTATNSKVKWSISDNKIATINDAGLVTAIQNGTVIVTATTLDGTNISANYNITITGNPLVNKIIVTGQNNEKTIVTAAGTLQMQAEVLPTDVPDKRVVWSVDKPEYASIDSNGLLTAKANGVVVVTATSVDLTSTKGQEIITITGNAEPTYRLATRFTYFHNDTETTYNSGVNWTSTVSMKNGASYPFTTTRGAYVQYKPNLLGISGNVVVNIYKNTSNTTFDSRARIEIYHNGKTDVVYTNLNSTRDDYYSIGMFDFVSDGTEYIRIVRDVDANAITPALPIRLDVYYDTQGRAQTAQEISENVPNGYTQTGTWTNSLIAGYRTFATPKESSTVGSVARWKPGNMDAGKYMIYAYLPNISAGDKYEIYHDSKVDIVYLKNLIQSNLNIDTKTGSPSNPMANSGWFKLGVFEFSGTGNEYVKLVKTSTATTFNDCLMFENVKLNGTILHRTVVTTNPYSGGLFSGFYPANFEAKEAAATIAPGLSLPGEKITDFVTTGLYNGSTVYSREYYFKKGTNVFHYLNPLVIEPGEYELSLYAGYVPASSTYVINTGAGTKTYSVPSSSFTQYKFTTIGKATFSGGLADEYIQIKTNRFADILLEKNSTNGAILKQVMLTSFPYYTDKVFPDTKGIAAEHDISVMVKKGFMVPVTASTFAPNNGMVRADFITTMAKILGLNPDTTLPTYSDLADTDVNKGYIGIAKKNGLLYGLPDATKIYPTEIVTREFAAQLMLNAMEFSGRYTNVKNLFKTDPAEILPTYTDASSISEFAREAIARMTECRALKPVNNMLLPQQALKRAEVASMLKEFRENILNSGPTNRKCDWELTFSDEFDGNQLDFTKWTCDDYVRFDPFAAKWKENCVVEDGLFKGYNYADNHKVPYSSGNITSKFKQNRGFFEARYKYPKCFGSHTSFWSSGGNSGDNNYNEGAYPNHVGTNNYFLNEPWRSQSMFNTEDNLSEDFHTNGGYTGENDIFYVWDGKPYGTVAPLEGKWNTAAILGITAPSTNALYPAQLSTVVSWFDGPLDRDQIDGTFAACDWVRVYREVKWLPELQPQACLPVHKADNQQITVSPVLKFNKAMDLNTLTSSTILISKIGGGSVPSYTINQITPLRFRIIFNQPLDFNSEYLVTVKWNVNDVIGNNMANDMIYSFKTLLLPELLPEACIPINKADNQPITVSPVLKFNKDMDASTLTNSTILISKIGGGTVPAYSISQLTPSTFKITFSQVLDLNSEYQFTVKSYVKDLIGSTMASDMLYSFKTLLLPELLPDLCTPVSKADNQPITVTPVLKFNKDMDASTLTTSTILISKIVGGTVPSYSISQVTPSSFKITFSQALDFSSEYQVTVKSNVKDLFGSSMASDMIYSFKIAQAKSDIYDLGSSNFKIQVESASCIGKKTGKISASITNTNYAYQVIVTGVNNYSNTQDIVLGTGAWSITGLEKGKYTVCFAIASEPNQKQCFDVEVTEPDPLSVYAKVDNTTGILDLVMLGAKTYTISVNGKATTVNSNDFSTVLPVGLNTINVTTDKDCQGIYNQEIFVSEKAFIYPNPTYGVLHIFVGGVENSIFYTLNDSSGATIKRSNLTVGETREITVDLSGIPQGNYLININSKTVNQTFKVIKL